MIVDVMTLMETHMYMNFNANTHLKVY